MGNNNQLHHFTDYLSVVFLFVVYIFIQVLLRYLFIELTQQTRLEKHFYWKVYQYAPSVYTSLEALDTFFSVCSTSRFIAVFGASVGSPGSARAVEKPWRALRCSSRSVSGGSDDVTAHHIWTCHRSNSPSPSAHMNVGSKAIEVRWQLSLTAKTRSFYRKGYLAMSKFRNFVHVHQGFLHWELHFRLWTWSKNIILSFCLSCLLCSLYSM